MRSAVCGTSWVYVALTPRRGRSGFARHHFCERRAKPDLLLNCKKAGLGAQRDFGPKGTCALSSWKLTGISPNVTFNINKLTKTYSSHILHTMNVKN